MAIPEAILLSIKFRCASKESVEGKVAVCAAIVCFNGLLAENASDFNVAKQLV